MPILGRQTLPPAVGTRRSLRCMNQAVYFCTGEVQPALYAHYGLAMERHLVSARARFQCQILDLHDQGFAQSAVTMESFLNLHGLCCCDDKTECHPTSLHVSSYPPESSTYWSIPSLSLPPSIPMPHLAASRRYAARLHSLHFAHPSVCGRPGAPLVGGGPGHRHFAGAAAKQGRWGWSRRGFKMVM